MDVASTLLNGLKGAAAGVVGGPIGMALGLVGGIAPDLVSALAPHLAGSRGAEVASAVVDTVKVITGHDDPTPADMAALPADQRVQLQTKMAEITLQAEQARLADAASQRQAELDAFKAQLADVTSARDAMVRLTQAGSKLGGGAALISTVILVGLFGIGWLLFSQARTMDTQTYGLAMTMLGALIAGFSDVRQFWLGSSAGSAQKDLMLYHSSPTPGAPPVRVQP